MICLFFSSFYHRYREWEIDTILTVMAIAKRNMKKTPQPFIALWNRLAFHFIYFMDTWISWEPCYYQISHKSFDFKSVESCVRCACFHRDRKMRLCNLMSPKQNYNTKRWSFIWISQLFMCIFSSVKEDKCCWKF